LLGHFDASIFSFYDYMQQVLGVKFAAGGKLDWWMRTAEVGLIYPLAKVCIISDRPETIKMKDGRLHCEDGMAVRYTDGFGVYVLNGVSMKPEYVLTPADKLEPETVFKEENVDVRRELLRKIGVLRMASYGRIVDEVGDYKLIDMSPICRGSDINYRPCLLMRNPSLPDVWHIERVADECQTVEQAINWQAWGDKDKKWQPISLS
jgi:hypothetical protein